MFPYSIPVDGVRSCGRRTATYWAHHVLHFLPATLVGLAIALAPGGLSSIGSSAFAMGAASTARQSVIVRLHPVRGGQVHGRATLTAAGGGTRVVLDISGLPAGSRAAVLIDYGTCSDLAHLSASSASLPNLEANATGRARARGRVLTALQRQNVPLSVLADGHHVVVIVLPGKGLVACGTIP